MSDIRDELQAAINARAREIATERLNAQRAAEAKAESINTFMSWLFGQLDDNENGN